MASGGGAGSQLVIKIKRQTVEKLENVRAQRDELISLINNIVAPAERAAEELLQANDKKCLLKMLESRNQIIQHVIDQLEIITAKLTEESESDEEEANNHRSISLSENLIPDLVSFPPAVQYQSIPEPHPQHQKVTALTSEDVIGLPQIGTSREPNLFQIETPTLSHLPQMKIPAKLQLPQNETPYESHLPQMEISPQLQQPKIEVAPEVSFIASSNLSYTGGAVHILDSGSPSEFYVKLASRSHHTIASQLDQLLGTAKCLFQRPILQVGCYYACRTAQSDSWRRAQIRSLDSDGVEVFFVDYGSIEVIIDVGGLAVLPFESSLIPALAVQCQLKDVAPLGGENWSLKVLTRFAEILWKSSTVFATFFPSDVEGKYLASLEITLECSIREIFNLSTKLVQENLARPLNLPAKANPDFRRPHLNPDVEGSPVRIDSTRVEKTRSVSSGEHDRVASAIILEQPVNVNDQLNGQLAKQPEIVKEVETAALKTPIILKEIFDDWEEYPARSPQGELKQVNTSKCQLAKQPAIVKEGESGALKNRRDVPDIFDDWIEYSASNPQMEPKPVHNIHNDSQNGSCNAPQPFSTGITSKNGCLTLLTGQPEFLHPFANQGVRPREPRKPIVPDLFSSLKPIETSSNEMGVSNASLSKERPKKLITEIDPVNSYDEESEVFNSALSEKFEHAEQDWTIDAAYENKDEESAYVWDAHLLNMVLEFPKDSTMEIQMSHVDSPSHFYIHPLTYETSKLDDVHRALQYLYKESDVPPALVVSPEQVVVTGRFYAAKWADDNSWYRCTVIASECEDTGEYYATVRFVDYGNTARLPFTDLRPLHRSLTGLPCLARLARLASIYPVPNNADVVEEEYKSVDWSYEATALFLDLTGYFEVFSAIVLPKSCSGNWPLDLVLLDKQSQIINSQLVVMGVAKSEIFGLTVFDQPGSPLPTSEMELFSPAPESELQLGADFANTGMALQPKGIAVQNQEKKPDVEGEEPLDSWDPMAEDYKSAHNNYVYDSGNLDCVLKGYIPKDDEKLCRFFRASGRCYKGNRCIFQHIFTGNVPYTLDKDEVLNEPPPMELPSPGTWISANIVVIHSSVCFTAILEKEENDEGETLDTLNEAIRETYGKTTFGTVLNPSMGEIVIAKWAKNKQFYRAKVIADDVVEEGVFKVMFTDFGNEARVHLRDMRKPEPRFMHLPFQAVCCWLDKVRTTGNSAEGVKFLESFVEGKLFKIRVHSQGVHELYVELFTANSNGYPEVSVNALVIDKRFAHYYVPAIQQKEIGRCSLTVGKFVPG